MSASEKILLCNFVAYLLVALFFFRRDCFKLNVKNVGFFGLALSALFSYLFYIQPGFVRTAHYSIMTPEPFVYLFPCLMILFFPLRKIDVSVVAENMHLLSEKKIDTVAKVAFPFLLFLLVAYTYQTANTSLVSMEDIRADLYDGRLKNPFFSSWIGATIDRLFNQLKVLLYCISFYALVCQKKKNFILCAFIVLPYIIGVERAYSTATRSEIFFILMLLLLQYLLYQNIIDRRMKKYFKIGAIVLCSLTVLLFISMSVSRFGTDVSLFYYKYAGEPMVNFNGLLFNNVRGTTNGTAYFWYIPSKLGLMDVSHTDLVSKWHYMESKTGVPGLFFYTIVGALIFEFGKIATVFVILGISIWERYIFSKKMTALTLVLASWVLYHLIASVFFLPIQGDSGVLSCLWLGLFYVWMEKRFVLKRRV